MEDDAFELTVFQCPFFIDGMTDGTAIIGLELDPKCLIHFSKICFRFVPRDKNGNIQMKTVEFLSSKEITKYFTIMKPGNYFLEFFLFNGNGDPNPVADPDGEVFHNLEEFNDDYPKVDLLPNTLHKIELGLTDEENGKNISTDGQLLH